MPFEGLNQWPAIQWKLRNIRQINPRSHKRAVDRLRAVLGISVEVDTVPRVAAES